MISGTVELHLRECYLAMPLEVMSDEYLLILTWVVITPFDWLNEVTDLRHNAFTTSSSSNKTASAFRLFGCLFAIKSANNA